MRRAMCQELLHTGLRLILRLYYRYTYLFSITRVQCSVSLGFSVLFFCILDVAGFNSVHLPTLCSVDGIIWNFDRKLHVHCTFRYHRWSRMLLICGSISIGMVGLT